MRKKIISLLLVLSMLLASAAPAFACIGKKSKITYTALGSSYTNGYGLSGFFGEDPIYELANNGTSIYLGLQELDGAYSCLLRDYLKDRYDDVTFYQLAQSGMRPEELRVLLDESYTGDNYTKQFYDADTGNGWWYSTIDSLRSTYKKAVSDADLITYELGSNTFCTVFLICSCFKNYNLYDLDFVLSEVMDEEDLARYQELRNKVKEFIDSSECEEFRSAAQDVVGITELLSYCLVGFCLNFDKTMGIIYELNPDANVVVLSMQNLLSGVKLDFNGVSLPVDDIFGAVLKLANNYMISGSPYSEKYLYTDMGEKVRFIMDDLLEWDGSSDICDDLKNCFDNFDWRVPLRIKYRVAEEMYKMYYGNVLEPLEEHSLEYTYYKTILESEISEAYNSALENAYKDLTAVLQQIGSEDTISFSGVNMDGADKNYANFAKNICYVNAAWGVNTVSEGAVSLDSIDSAVSASEEAAEVLLSSENIMSSVYFLRGKLGSSALSHPDHQGEEEMFNKLKKNINISLSKITSQNIKLETKEKTEDAVKEAVSKIKESQDKLRSTVKEIRSERMERFLEGLEKLREQRITHIKEKTENRYSLLPLKVFSY